MTPGADELERALAPDAAWLAQLRSRWSALAEAAVWGRLASAKIDALPRLRKRVLELGEKLAALGASREVADAPLGQYAGRWTELLESQRGDCDKE